MDLLPKEAKETFVEVKVAAQQLTLTLATVNEFIRNVNETVLVIKDIAIIVKHATDRKLDSRIHNGK